MSRHLFDHIDLRVSDLAAARQLYDAFLPGVGFGAVKAGETWASYSASADSASTAPFVELNELRGHRGNATRIAFWADSEEEVNRLGEIVRAAGALVIEGPEYCFEYTPGYYGVFFEDRDGNKWEVCCRNALARTETGAP